jgi:hypothetical protein
MNKVYLSKPTRKNKKYSVIVLDGSKTQGHKKINFGDDRYEDFTQHKDDERKKRYILRHKKSEDWNDPSTAGFWSRWLLWNKPSIEEAKKHIYSKFGIKVLSV